MLHLGVIILTMSCLGLSSDCMEISDTNMDIIMKKLKAIDEKIEGKLNVMNERIEEIETKNNDKIDDKLKFLESKNAKINLKLESKIDRKLGALNERIVKIEKENIDAIVDNNYEKTAGKFGVLESMIEQRLESKINKKLEVINEKIDNRIDEIVGKNIDAIIYINDESDKMIREPTESDKRMPKMNGVIKDEKANDKNLKKLKEEKQMNVAQNSTDLEERVRELEDQMYVVQIGLAAVTDNVDELQEAENVQNQNILFLQQEVDQIEDTANGTC